MIITISRARTAVTGGVTLLALVACQGDGADRPITGPGEAIRGTITSDDDESLVQVTIVRVVSGRDYRPGDAGIQVGDPVYIDRADTYASLPDFVKGQTYILTADDDWNHGGHGNFFRFRIDREATVLVAFLNGANTPPWLRNNFEPTGELVTVSRGNVQLVYQLHAKTFPPGEVVLGSNRPGNSAAMYTVIVSATPNEPPLADPGGPYSGAEGSTIQFDGSASTDPDGQFPLTYSWDFGDGATGTGEQPTHSYADNGEYTVTLTVRDAAGGVSAPASTTATISNVAPSVNAGADATIGEGGTFSLSATFSDPGVADAPWSYTIDWGVGGAPSSGSTSDQSAAITGIRTYFESGIYVVRVTVTDKDGDSGFDEVTVHVVSGPPPDGPFSDITAGFHHSCALTHEGAAYCWGRNDNRGQLGDGTFVNRQTPVAVIGGLTFSTISGGALHTCALTPAGEAYCWGRNNHGQLGNNGTTDTNRPVAVVGNLTFSSISAGEHHTCALATNGQAYCWGRNNRGQLGDDTNNSINRPVPVVGGFAFAFLRAGYQHSCGIAPGGAAYCWGRNQMGQLGDGTTNDRRRPTAVVGGLVFSTLTASQNADGSQHHTCGITTNGLAYCWGDNWHNQLGIGNGIRGFRTTPQLVPNVPIFAAVASGGDHNCAVDPNGEVWCWGDGLRGQLGGGPAGDYNDPAPIDMTGRDERGALRTGKAFRIITGGWDHTCGVTTDGEAWCWGWNGHSQLGIDSTNNRARPQRVLFP